MRKILLFSISLLTGLTAFGLLSPNNEIQARPQYLHGFINQYPGLTEQAKKAKCGMCHPQNDRIRNEYGGAVGQGLRGVNVKIPGVIQAALNNAESAKPTNGQQTFGQIIQGGELPHGRP